MMLMKKGIDIENIINKLLEKNIIKANFIDKIHVFHDKIINSESKFKRISKIMENNEELYDLIVEIMYALLFLDNGFSVEAEPLGDNGPDFRIYDGDYSSYLEVKRIRYTNPGPLSSKLDGSHNLYDLDEYKDYKGCERNSNRDVQKIIEKIESSQIVENMNNILSIWCDDGCIEKLNFELACNELYDNFNHIKYIDYIIYRDVFYYFNSFIFN